MTATTATSDKMSYDDAARWMLNHATKKVDDDTRTRRTYNGNLSYITHRLRDMTINAATAVFYGIAVEEGPKALAKALGETLSQNEATGDFFRDGERAARREAATRVWSEFAEYLDSALIAAALTR